MVKELDAMYDKVKKHKITMDEKVFDYSVVLGVHSQLNMLAEFIWRKIIFGRQNLNEILWKKDKELYWNFSSKQAKAYIMEMLSIEIMDRI